MRINDENDTSYDKGTDDSLFFPKDIDLGDDFLSEVTESLKSQISDEMVSAEDSTENGDNEEITQKKKNKGFKIAGIIALCLVLIVGFLGGTKAGRRIIYNIAGSYLHDKMDNNNGSSLNPDNGSLIIADDEKEDDPNKRHEDYVTNFLLVGIEQIQGGNRTDSMMIASINTLDDTIKLTSLMRDTYVEIPGHSKNKLNAAYAKGGIDLLIDTIELNYKIRLDGFATVNFDAFEKVIDRLGGVEIELGETEASYLRTTNYISNPAYRTVKAGWNNLNGNQALGYCRVRKVPTLGGANSDFGRTLRQRRVLNALFEKYKSKNVFELISIMNECLGYVTTDLTSSQISAAIEAVIENGITTIDNARIPTDELYTAERYDVGAVLVPDWDANIEFLYQFIFLDKPASDTDASTETQIDADFGVTTTP
ncbi:MAG: LytR family transcriptional regulator [Lachnospiraceae bacterium]|nr:LytR family transcriptional regulator [Lachnospiraceae bacterium]